MIVRNIFSIIVLSFLTFSIVGCSVNQASLEDSVKKENEREPVSAVLLNDINYILYLLQQNDLNTLNNRYINPTFGLYYVNKDENIPNKITFTQKLQIDEISNTIISFDIKQEEVFFNCSPYNDAFYGWNKDGIFLTPNTKPYLSQQMIETNKIEINKYKEDDIKRAIFIEKTSYELVIPYNVILYMTKIDNNWYITLIDNLTTDCSK